MPVSSVGPYLSASEAAAVLQGRISRETVIQLIRSGELMGKRINGEWHILPEWLAVYMNKPEAGKTPPVAFQETEGSDFCWLP